MGIIRIYRSSVTHWCKFGVHTLCCSRDRAVFLLQCGKTAFLESILMGTVEDIRTYECKASTQTYFTLTFFTIALFLKGSLAHYIM